MDLRNGAEDLNNYEDLLQHFTNSMGIIEHCNALRKEKSRRDNVLEKLAEDVENLRKSERNLTDQLRAMCARRDGEECLSGLYEKLKEKYSSLEKRCEELARANDVLREEHSSQLVELEEHYKGRHSVTVAEFEIKLDSVRAQLEQERNLFLDRETKLYNELQLAQASIALQVDESEVKVECLQLQLQDTLNSHNVLRQDYLSMKAQSKYELDLANKAVSDLEHRLRITEQQLRLNQEQLLKRTSHIPTTINPTSTTHKYQVLDVTTSVGAKNPPSDMHVRSVAKAVDGIAKETKKNYLPPLRQLTNTGQKSIQPKKRKLYNPGKVNLEDLMEMP